MTMISANRLTRAGAAVAAALSLAMLAAAPAMAQDDAAAPAAEEAAPAEGAGEIDPVTGLPAAPAGEIDPITGLPVDAAPAAPAAFDPNIDPVTGLPIDLLTEEELAAEAENPYSFQHMWEQGDIVARSTLIVMIVMFSASWYIIVTKSIEQTRLMGQSKRLRGFWAAPTVSDGLNHLGAKNPYRPMAQMADTTAQERQEGIAARIDAHRRAEIDLGRSIDFINARLQSGMAILATVGATAPFVGLLGTVWGIRNALIELGLSGEPSIERIAGPVGEALLMTAIGLIVAVPAVFFYNVLARRNKKVMDTVRAFAADIDALIISDRR